MSEDDLRRIAVAAADKETAAFELDHADLNLKEAVVVALEHGTPPEVIAQVADLGPEEVIDLVHDSEEPALLTLDEVDPANAQEAAAPATLAPIVQDANRVPLLAESFAGSILSSGPSWIKRLQLATRGINLSRASR